MKAFLALLTTTLLLVGAFGIANAQVAQNPDPIGATQQKPAQQMSMMKGMMGQNEGGMKCPMCAQMMSEGMMGNQDGMMSEMPMMGDMMKQMMGGQRGMMGKMHQANLPDAQALLAVSDELKLADNQIQSLKDIALRTQKESIKKQAELEVARLELNALLDREQIDTEQVRQKLNQAATLETDLKMAQIQNSVAAKAVLTAEQRALFKDVTKKGKMMMQSGEKAEKSTPEASEHEKHH